MHNGGDIIARAGLFSAKWAVTAKVFQSSDIKYKRHFIAHTGAANYHWTSQKRIPQSVFGHTAVPGLA